MKNLHKINLLIAAVFLALLFIYSATNAQELSFDLASIRERDPELTAAYDKVKVQQAWEEVLESGINLENQFTTIGVIDTGVDASHQEFTEVLLDTDVFKDFQTGGHGTQVIGIIGADNKAGLGISGIDSNEMNGIMSGATDKYLMISNHGIGKKVPKTFSLRSAIADMASKHNVSVINYSGGISRCSILPFIGVASCISDEEFEANLNAFKDVMSLFSDSVLFVIAAGNQGLDAFETVPAAVNLPNTIAVSATNLEDGRAIFPGAFGKESNFGSVVDIAAPGEQVYAPRPRDIFEFTDQYDESFSGTSASAPFVTGVAGLIKAIQPGFTPERIKSILTNSADPIKTGEPQKTMGNACHSNPDIIPQQKTGTTACRLNALSAVKTVTPFYNYKMDFVSVDGNTPSSPGCNTNRQGQPVSFFDDFDDGSTNTGCTALFSKLGTFGEEAGHLTLNSNDAVSSTGFRVHTATLQTSFQEGGGNSQVEVSFKSDTPFGASGDGFSNYGLFLRENVPSNIPALSIQAGSIEGRTFLNAIQFPEVITSQAFLSLSDLDNLVLKIELNDTSNLATPLFSIDNGNTFIPFRNPDNTIFRVPAFRESPDASLQVFGSLFLPQTSVQTQSQLLLPQNLPFTPVIME